MMEGLYMQLINYQLHDSIIEKICILSDKDFIDKVFIDILGVDNNYYRIMCEECIFCNIKSNGWIVGKDSIRNFDYKEGELCEGLVPSFIPDEIKRKVQYINVNMNTSNSNIEILALNININKYEN